MKIKYIIMLLTSMLIASCASNNYEKKNGDIVIVNRFSNNPIQKPLIDTFKNVINKEQKKNGSLWIHNIKIYYTNNMPKNLINDLKNDLKNDFNLEAIFEVLAPIDNKKLLIWKVNLTNEKLINCQKWEVNDFSYLSSNDKEIKSFNELSPCESIEFNNSIELNHDS